MTPLEKKKFRQYLLDLLGRYESRSQKWKNEQEAYFTLDWKGMAGTIKAGLYDHTKKMGVLLKEIRQFLDKGGFDQEMYNN